MPSLRAPAPRPPVPVAQSSPTPSTTNPSTPGQCSTLTGFLQPPRDSEHAVVPEHSPPSHARHLRGVGVAMPPSARESRVRRARLSRSFWRRFGVSDVVRAAPFGRGPEGALQWANLHFSSRLAAPELAGGAQLRRPGALQENASSVKTNQQQRNATRAALFFQPAQPEAHAPRCLEPHTSLDRLPAPGWGRGVACRGGVRHQLRRRARVAREMAPPPPGEDL